MFAIGQLLRIVTHERVCRARIVREYAQALLKTPAPKRSVIKQSLNA
jgi:hypothetical protein